MRDLTEEELKLAPEWATQYSITSNNNIRFHDDYKFVLCNGYIVSGVSHVSPCNFETNKVPQKKINMGEHEFSDERLSFIGGTFDVCIDTCDCCGGTVSDVVNFDFNKQDAIAIAKALGVTAKDLEQQLW